jgi:hypothetical protein
MRIEPRILREHARKSCERSRSLRPNFVAVDAASAAFRGPGLHDGCAPAVHAVAGRPGPPAIHTSLETGPDTMSLSNRCTTGERDDTPCATAITEPTEKLAH